MMADSKQGTRWYNIDELMLWDDNPNQGDQGAIISSVNQFGYNDVAAIYHGVIMGGNHRIQAIQQLLQGGYVPTERDTQLRAVNGHYEVTGMDVSHFETQAQANAFALALNRTARLGHDDPAMLAALLQDIAAQDVKLMESSGFSGDDLDELLEELAAPVFAVDKQAKPNPRNLSIDVIYTATFTLSCCLATKAGLKYGIQSGKQVCLFCGNMVGHELIFIDNDYFNYDHVTHLDAVKEFKPRYATVRDVMTPSQCRKDDITHYPLEQILDWAEELGEYAENVIVIPKYDCLDKISEKFMLGYSVPTSHGGTPLPPEAFKGRRVHLLGGSWKKQIYHMAIMGDDVVSIDNNYVGRISNYGSWIDPDGNEKKLTSGLGLAWIKNPIYVAFSISCESIAAKVNELYPQAVEVPALSNTKEVENVRSKH